MARKKDEDGKVDNLGREDRRAAFTTEVIIKAVVDARGDLLTTSKFLRISLRELDNILKAIPEIRTVLGSIAEIAADNPEYMKMTAELFERQVVRAQSMYRLAAIDSLYELATMPVTNTAAMMNVKREAAVNLMGRETSGGGGALGELTEFFRSLNSDYQSKKDGVTVTRAILIEQRRGEPVESQLVETLEALPQSESLPSADRAPVATQDRSS